MIKLLEKAIEAVRNLMPEEQDKIAQMILAMAVNDEDDEDIDPEHLDAIDRGLDDLKNGRIATDDEVAAAFQSFENRECSSH